MSSSSSAMLTTLGVTFGIPLVNSAAGAVVGASGAALLSIQHDNYDVLLATKVGTAGSAILSLPVVLVLAPLAAEVKQVRKAPMLLACLPCLIWFLLRFLVKLAMQLLIEKAAK